MPLTDLTPAIYTPGDRRILIHGRHTPDSSGAASSAALFWTGSGIEFATDSPEAYIGLRCDSEDTMEQWVSIEINGAPVARFPVTPESEGDFPIMLGREKGQRSVVRVFKDVQPMRDACSSCLYVDYISIDRDAELLEPPHRDLKIEFIGDSITSGEGIIGPGGAPDWIPMWFSGSLGYPNLVSKALNADFRVISQSGWGLISGYDNHPEHAVPLVYDQVCGVLNSEHQSKMGTMEPNDFSAWQPDVIVVNLGTNDYGAMNGEPFTDADGRVYKQENTPEHREEFRLRAAEFLRHLREKNPGAYIIWLFGMFPTELREAVIGAIAHRLAAGDYRVDFLEVEPVTDDELGSRWHPGFPAHSRVAESLVRRIGKLGIIRN